MSRDNGTQIVVESVLEGTNQVTWDELCEVKTKTMTLGKYGGKTITYRTMVPLDVAARLQAQHLNSGKKDWLGYYKDLLKYIIVGPAITTDAHMRAVVHADSGVLYQIMNEAMSEKAADEMRDALGGDESLGEESPA